MARLPGFVILLLFAATMSRGLMLNKEQQDIRMTPKKISALVKLTNVHCESYNKTLYVFNYCRLKAVRRNVAALYIRMNMNIVADIIHLNIQLWKKESGYKPFLINFTIDGCDYLKKRNHPFANIIFDQFRNYSSANHLCPYEGTQFLDGYYPVPDLRTPFPSGDYLLTLDWYIRGVQGFSTNVYFLLNL